MRLNVQHYIINNIINSKKIISIVFFSGLLHVAITIQVDNTLILIPGISAIYRGKKFRQKTIM